MTNKGKLIVIEGLDGTGKATQVKMLIDYLVIIKKMHYGKNVIAVDFPRYDKPSSDMVKNYLSGKFGTDPNAINPYVASSFYAVDRAISFQTEEWGEVYRNGGIVIADRYTISNIIHQGAKLVKEHPNSADYCINEFVKWINEYEYSYMGIPEPTLVITLKMDKEVNEKLIKERQENAVEGDIHEANFEYLDNCRTALNYYLEADTVVNGYIPHVSVKTNDNNGKIYTRGEISDTITSIVDSIMEWDN